ncbi:MAG: hypothetical protein MUC92_02090, partial [Fimbriimonadaceae bacterium]|nr:hypothetical protein [Fimbriimonadaceae bacterium]
MAAYAVTALRETFPDAELAWAIEDTCEPLVDTNQLVNKVFVTDRAEWRKARGSLKTISATYRAMIKVRTFRPQIGFDFQGHLKTAICLRLSGARTRLSWGATDSVSRNFNRLVPPSPESIHMVEKHFGLINSWKPCERPQFPLIPKVKSAIGTGHVSIQTGSGGLG